MKILSGENVRSIFLHYTKVLVYKVLSALLYVITDVLDYDTE